jgi:hypothetical protein
MAGHRDQILPDPTEEVAGTFNGPSSQTQIPGRNGMADQFKPVGSVLALRASISSFMDLHMRTTIDVPDDLHKQVRPLIAACPT